MLWHCLAVLTFIGVRRQIQDVFRLLTDKNVILCLKLPLKLCRHSILTFLLSLQYPIFAHHHCYLQMLKLNPNQCNCQVSTSQTLQFLRYNLENSFR